ncbi:MAG: PilN domain-containing protein [Sedimentibacter sp.]
MVDLNFFEPYVERRKLKFDRNALLYIVLGLCIIGIAALGAFNQLQINSLRSQAAGRRQIAEEPKTLEKYKQIKELENQMAVFKEEMDKIVKMDKNIAKSNIISEALIFEIKSKMPENLFLTNFNAEGRDMEITGVAKDTNSIAEFSKSLRDINDVESVFISSIENLEGNYNFVLNTTFKDVNIDEEAEE